MQMTEIVIWSGVVFVLLIVAHGLWSSWRKRRDSELLRVQEPFATRAEDERAGDDFNGELPNGGVARPVGNGASEWGSVADAGAPASGDHPELFDTQLDAPESWEETVATPDAAEPADEAQPGVSAGMTASEVESVDDAAADWGETREPQTVEPAQASAEAPDQAPPMATEAEPVTASPDNGEIDQPAGKVEDLLVVHVMAPSEQAFDGDQLLRAIRAEGLKYGSMRIFHREDPDTRDAVFRLARSVEPGEFDLTNTHACASPGITAFIRLPGPRAPTDALEDMLASIRNIAGALGGEIMDERQNPLTADTLKDYRQRAASFEA